MDMKNLGSQFLLLGFACSLILYSFHFTDNLRQSQQGQEPLYPRYTRRMVGAVGHQG